MHRSLYIWNILVYNTLGSLCTELENDDKIRKDKLSGED
jgi:hypothetical protein